MTSFNELVIGSSQGFAFLLKIITEVFQDYVHLQGHGLAMISHKCEPSVSKEFNLFSVVDFYCLCVCHSNSPTVCSALKNGHLLCRIEHFHFLDGMLTSCVHFLLNTLYHFITFLDSVSQGLQTGHWRNPGSYSKKTDFRAKIRKFCPKKKDSLLDPNHVPATTGQCCPKEKVPFYQIINGE